MSNTQKQYKVTNSLGDKTFNRESDAYDYAIKIIKQTGIKSEIEEIK